MSMNTKQLYTGIGIAIVVLVGIGVWYFQTRKTTPEIPGVIPREEASLGAQLFEEAANPVKKSLPETNPFEQVNTNPIDKIYKNPFQ
ncbi:MAG: hypothetical protein HYV55_00685 [Parcubacteria group bacterium]|nr:hypothetical protein [Parcubacteria group bacterium]